MTTTTLPGWTTTPLDEHEGLDQARLIAAAAERVPAPDGAAPGPYPDHWTRDLPMPHPLALTLDPHDCPGLTQSPGAVVRLGQVLRALPATLEALGVTVDRHEPDRWTVHGPDGTALGSVTRRVWGADGDVDGWRGYVQWHATTARTSAYGDGLGLAHPGLAVLEVLTRALLTAPADPSAAPRPDGADHPGLTPATRADHDYVPCPSCAGCLVESDAHGLEGWACFC